MTLRQSVLALLISATIMAPAASASAGPLIDLLKVRQTKLDKLLKTRTADMTKAQKDELSKTLGDAFDFSAMAQSALGEEWAKRAAAEQKRFTEEFERLVRATSMRGVDSYRSQGVAYKDETIKGKSGKVKTTVNSKNAITEVEYTFLKNKTGWAIVDYTIDGVSAVRNYRVQFAKIIDKHGWDELVKRVHTRVVKLETAGENGEDGKDDDATP